MTRTLPRAEQHPLQALEGPGRTDRLLLVLAIVLVVGVVAAVLLFGVERPPPLTRLAEQPDPGPSAAVAWTAWERDESCFHVAAPSGDVERRWCSRSPDDVIAWTEDDRLLVMRWSGDTEHVLELDPDTGAVLDRRAPGADLDRGPPQPGVLTLRDGEDLVLLLGTRRGTELWRVEAGPTYDVHTAVVSPDGDWVALLDEARRLLVLPTDGSQPPRVWATGVPPWTALLWQGGDGAG